MNPHCIALEDSVSGIKSAQAAQMITIGITTTHTAAEISSADKIISSFDEFEYGEDRNAVTVADFFLEITNYLAP